MRAETGFVVEIGKMAESVGRAATFAIFERYICVILQLLIAFAGDRFVAQPTCCSDCGPAQREQQHAYRSANKGGVLGHLRKGIEGLRP